MGNSPKQDMLKQLPGVDRLLEAARRDNRFSGMPLKVLTDCARRVLDRTRTAVLDGNKISILPDRILSDMAAEADGILSPRLVPLVNATGVVLHTNLGRSPLSENALKAVHDVAAGYSNLEFDMTAGRRGLRYDAVEPLICELTGAEAAIAVNNNAGAVLLSLDTLARGREVIVSRGELVEIGGAFRIPDVMVKSGAGLKEVGTTNRTHPRDYEQAISPETGLLLKVHTSNYRIEGFTASVSLPALVKIGQQHGIPVMEDLGSGTLVDLSRFGLAREPTVGTAVTSGADVVTFSGDKLLGGPQAGIIVGRQETLDRIKSNPLTRALRIDKLTLAALESTLSLYRDEPEALSTIPALRMLTTTFEETVKKAEALAARLSAIAGQRADIICADLSSRTGGGAFPGLNLPSRCVTIACPEMGASQLEKRFRRHQPAIIGRIENERFIIDTRTLLPGQDTVIGDALKQILSD